LVVPHHGRHRRRAKDTRKSLQCRYVSPAAAAPPPLPATLPLAEVLLMVTHSSTPHTGAAGAAALADHGAVNDATNSEAAPRDMRACGVTPCDEDGVSRDELPTT